MGFWDFLDFDSIPNDSAPLTRFQYICVVIFFTVCLFCIIAGTYLLHGGNNPHNNAPNKNAKKD